MKKETQKFVEAYNQRTDWNSEILKEAQLSPNNCSGDFLRNLLDGYMTQEKITEENYDLENAEVYDSIRGQKELQAFSKESLRTHYFWCTPTISETDYKNEHLAIVTKEINRRRTDLVSQIRTLQDELKELDFYYDNLIKCNKN